MRKTIDKVIHNCAWALGLPPLFWNTLKWSYGYVYRYYSKNIISNIKDDNKLGRNPGFHRTLLEHIDEQKAFSNYAESFIFNAKLKPTKV